MPPILLAPGKKGVRYLFATKAFDGEPGTANLSLHRQSSSLSRLRNVLAELQHLADVRKGFVIVVVYDLRTRLGRDTEIDFSADGDTGSLIPLAFLSLPGIAVSKWLAVDGSWGLLAPLVVSLANLDIMLASTVSSRFGV